MNRNSLRKALGPLAGAAAVLAVLVVALPPAAKALVATLVQVVNTPTNAIPTVHAPSAANLYYSSCGGSYNVVGACALAPVPAGQTLFVESISVVAGGPHGTLSTYATLEGVVASVPTFFSFPLRTVYANATGDDSLVGAYSGRISTSAGTPVCEGPASTTGAVGLINFSCNVYGYLTPTT